MKKGDIAPEFTLQDKDGKEVSLSNFRGRKVVLYFYPKDNTPGCTRQAVAFAENYAEFERRGIVVIGVSKDSVESHNKFQEKFEEIEAPVPKAAKAEPKAKPAAKAAPKAKPATKAAPKKPATKAAPKAKPAAKDDKAE